MRPARFFQAVVACLTTCAALAQQSGSPPAPAPPDEEDIPEVEEEWDFGKSRGLDPVMMERLNLMLPPGGKPHEGLTYPVYGERISGGAPLREALFESKRVTRLDETHILFEGAVYTSYGDAKRPNTPTQTVSFKDAVYDLQNHLVSSTAPIAVDGRQVSIHCGGVIHDLSTGFTIYAGRVELYMDDEAMEEINPAPADSKSATSAPKTPPPPLDSK
ncbi:MAG TPA: hypothetical protein VG796_12685 [Verrucomicrobiales bacterium]|jgi:hypothetical protein|nr:hypothetical protein [Verrucomicrobiales bacterium]